MNIINKFLSDIKTNKELRRKAEIGNKATDKVWLYNFWGIKAEEMWLARFMAHRGLLEGDKRISFYSVFGNRKIEQYDRRDIKMFVTAENVHREMWSKYGDNFLSNKNIDLSIGFDYIKDERYVRMPIWLRSQFSPEWDEAEIRKHVQELRYPVIDGRNEFCAMIASHDDADLRRIITTELSMIHKVSCPGKLLHNDDTLLKQFGDNKKEYLKQFRFNICPENSDYPGYVTEKIFDAIAAGCIPIYWGSDNKPELDVLNQNALILWDFDDDNTKNIVKIENLWNNKDLLFEMLHQPRLVDGAEDVILAYFSRLENAFAELL